MQEKNLFEYAVIRIMPRVEREEFINVGVIVYCASQGFLQCKFNLDEIRVHSLFKEIDIQEVKNYLVAFQQICEGGVDSGTIGALPIASRFRWLTATRSTVVQTSKVHPGFCDNPKVTLDKLFHQLVL